MFPLLHRRYVKYWMLRGPNTPLFQACHIISYEKNYNYYVSRQAYVMKLVGKANISVRISSFLQDLL